MCNSCPIKQLAHARPNLERRLLNFFAEDLCSILPKGLLVIGAYACLKPGATGAVAEEAACSKDLTAGAFQLRRAMQQVRGEAEDGSWNGCLAATISSDSSGSITAANGWSSTWHLSDGRGKVVPIKEVHVSQEMPELLWRRHTLVRCCMSMELPVRVPSGQSGGREAYKAAVDSAMDSEKAVFVATCPSATGSGGHSAYVDPSLSLSFGEDSRPLSGAAAGASSGGDDIVEDFMKGNYVLMKTAGGGKVPVPLQLTLRLKSGRGGQGQVAGPLLSYEPGSSANETLRWVRLDVDVLCVCPKQWTLRRASARLILPALRCQLAALGALAASDPADNVKLSAFHFLPPTLPHPITALYSLSRGEAEARAVASRAALHSRLGLPPDRPMLRSANALTFGLGAASGTVPGGSSGSARLLDVHVGLSRSGVGGGVVSLVQGSYEYYHYMQDRIDDGGWGCAYRSLQTIVSWFRLQHYTATPVPSHRAIQQALVDIGDKEAAFVGSSKWIGAIELSYVLDHLIGVTCKILTIQSGADMPSKGRELARHFQTQGTPVMIGGGVLAYTLLGVDFNELTGDCAFLILDPHYTGGEDLKSIRQGGWCGWKHPVNEVGQSFFVRDAFYNLLLPQRPSTV